MSLKEDLIMDDLDRTITALWNFVGNAPWYILSSFLVSFLGTKLLASQAVYEYICQKFSGSKLTQAQKIRQEWLQAEKLFAAEGKEKALSDDDLADLQQARQFYRAQIHKLYDFSGKEDNL
jgi:hypothetical protein